ncbi:hypothetical protein TL16_g10846 [Triparma laevis f. inornata]|uniref:Kinesin-like protein n=1 Tax=Triparma laevis f. inornata TaxID=1714386 RepID=A0A9W7BF52_9STRA|nr:hypothetical protein TL16_g10846 [Triparma laevis f. inornata]
MGTVQMASNVSVKVAVRMRPFNNNEKAAGSNQCIIMNKEHNQVVIKNPEGKEGGEDKVFTYDYVYDSCLPEEDENYAGQDTVWDDLGMELLEAAWAGYNYSLFAYGQTGSGKSHSMVGFGEARGVIPRACEAIFKKMRGDGESSGGVRDSPSTGAYVFGLKKIPVVSYSQIERLMAFGTKNRTVAATNMNETSSRAHTIFCIAFVQTVVNRDTMKANDIRSEISLVDLAGSERVSRTGASGDRLVEGGHINKSLSALGNVINALAKNGTSKGKKKILVPYRDAVLTHLLKNSLGGNAKTTMIAAVSPSEDSYAEVKSQHAKSLRRQLEGKDAKLDLEAEREKIKRELEEKFQRELQEKQALWEKEMNGVDGGVEEEGLEEEVGGMYLVNLNEDAALSGVLKYKLKAGENWVGIVSMVGARTLVNGVVIEAGVKTRVGNMDRLIFGNNSVFKIVFVGVEWGGEEVDWEMAMKEANSELLKAMSAANIEKDEEEEKERKEMDAKVKVLEEQLRAEREKIGDNEARLKGQQKELEEKLETQIKETEKLLRRQEKERQERSLIDRQLLHTLPLVHEANGISEEMLKQMKFSVKLVSKALDPLEIYIMREMYHEWKDRDGDLSGTEFEGEEGDPFYDPPSDYLLGVARLQLEALKYMLDVDEATPLVDYKGSSFGEILVEMVPEMGEGQGVQGEDVEDLEEVVGKNLGIGVRVKGLRGLPMGLLKGSAYKSVYVKYRFFGGDEYLVGGMMGLKMNVTMDWKEELKFVVTKDLCEFVVGAALGFEVWVSAGVRSEEAEAEEVKAAVEEVEGEEEEEEEEDEVTTLKKENEELREKLAQAMRLIEVLKGAGGGGGEEGSRTVANLGVAKGVDSIING